MSEKKTPTVGQYLADVACKAYFAKTGQQITEKAEQERLQAGLEVIVSTQDSHPISLLTKAIATTMIKEGKDDKISKYLSEIASNYNGGHWSLLYGCGHDDGHGGHGHGGHGHDDHGHGHGGHGHDDHGHGHGGHGHDDHGHGHGGHGHDDHGHGHGSGNSHKSGRSGNHN